MTPDEPPKPFCKLEAVSCERQVEQLPPRAEPAPLESPIVPPTDTPSGAPGTVIARLPDLLIACGEPYRG